MHPIVNIENLARHGAEGGRKEARRDGANVVRVEVLLQGGVRQVVVDANLRSMAVTGARM